MITLIHGGQTGVDRGAHDAAIAAGWKIAGYMPRDRRDELGPIPEEVARYLIPHTEASYTSRTRANVLWCSALLVIVVDRDDPRATPGTARTLEYAEEFRRPYRVVDGRTPEETVARWIWEDLIQTSRTTLPLALDSQSAPTPPTVRLMVAGPRESCWHGACDATVGILRRVSRALATIDPA